MVRLSTSATATTTSSSSSSSSSTSAAVASAVVDTTTTNTTAITTSTTATTTTTAATTTRTTTPSMGVISSLTALTELVKYAPLRLTEEERSLLIVLEQTLHVSEYTDHVDVVVSQRQRGIKARRILDGILEVCHIAIGLIIASGQQQQMTEVGMSHNNNNTDKTTTTRGTAASNPFWAKKKQQQQQLNGHNNNNNNNNNSAKSKNGRITRRSKNNDNNSSRLAAATTSTTCPPSSSSDPNNSNNNNTISLLKPYGPLLQRMFEVGRRNKVLNPNQMRTTHGKLMYLLQDAQSPSIAKSLGFSLFQDLQLVGPYLEQNKAACLLRDERLLIATQYIISPTTTSTTASSCNDVNHNNNHDASNVNGDNSSMKKAARNEDNDRTILQQRVAAKHQALEELVEEYSLPATALSKDDLRRCIESIADAVAYVQANVSPVHAMMDYLTTNFDPQQIHNGFSLEIQSGNYNSNSSSVYSRYNLYDGRMSTLSYYSSSPSSSSSGGATLNHSHSTQYTFVWQTLQLWSKVMQNMHMLWVCADADLLSTHTSYHLYNTGQGLQRVQTCPKVGKAMRQLLVSAQQQTQSPWVGLSVIHLGDRDVPNALVFIDKYAQIPRFLHPLVDVCQSLPLMAHFDARLRQYIIQQFTSVHRLFLIVLCDYYKHGFDGSGDDGGSCIDGRLTSSWNWTSRLSKKSYYYAFLLCGFQGFDGDFK